MTGGGSGGHITPLIAIAAELKRLNSSTEVIYIGQRGDSFGQKLANNSSIDAVKFISAGKFRRYHGEKWQWLNLKTLALNVRDLVRFLFGTVESWYILGRLKPDAVFAKGGFVGVPVGLAAAARKVPFITHDSDSVPGLANRIIGRWAAYNAVALPNGEHKSYPENKMVVVGIPVRSVYKKISATDQNNAKDKLGLSNYDQVLLVTGGGLGAMHLNSAVIELAPKILDKYPRLALVHQVGEKQLEKAKNAYQKSLSKDNYERVTVLGYSSDIYNYSAAADVIITRAGATTLAEYGVQQKPCIVIPSSNLAGGHQLKNAELLAKEKAVLMVTENKNTNESLMEALDLLLTSAKDRELLAGNLHGLMVTNSAERLAKLIIKVAHKRQSP